MSAVINGFWILVSAILGLSVIVLSAYGIWKALEMKEEDEQRTKANREIANREIANREKAMNELRFDGMSLFEMTMTTGRLLREDKKRRTKKRGYAV